MKKFLSDSDIDKLCEHVRPETLEPCYKQVGKKDAQPMYNRPTHNEVRALAKIIGCEGSQLGLLIGVDGRRARRWQSPSGEFPTYTQWLAICLLAAKNIP